MSLIERLFKYAEDIYAGAAQEFRDRHFHFAATTASATVSIAIFILSDQDTPKALLGPAENLRQAAERLKAEARSAEVHREGLQGRRTFGDDEALSRFFQDAYARASQG